MLGKDALAWQEQWQQQWREQQVVCPGLLSHRFMSQSLLKLMLWGMLHQSLCRRGLLLGHLLQGLC